MSSKESLIKSMQDRGLLKSKLVREAFQKVHREHFVLPEYKDNAYADYPLPIPAGQTISQPTTVAIMLEALELHPGMNVLEIGTGSGYNAALLGTIVGKASTVISTEFVPELVTFARNNLKKENVQNVVVIPTPHSLGYPQKAPYDRIIVTAAPEKVPRELFEQLKGGGILLVPVGPSYAQKLLKLRKVKGRIIEETLGDFVFVPLRK